MFSGTSEHAQTTYQKIKKKDFFSKFHPKNMPVCSVFEAFWHVWAKYFFGLQKLSLSLELEHL